jgi:hypothetical protein
VSTRHDSRKDRKSEPLTDRLVAQRLDQVPADPLRRAIVT